jgi:hypothetical protein
MRLSVLVPVLVIAVSLLLTSGCTTTTPAGPSTPATTTPLLSVSIKPDITHYTVLMSSAPGIGLSPNITGQPQPANLTCEWTTNYGHFLGGDAPDYTVNELGTIVSGNRTKVYWTYIGENVSFPRPQVHISLAVTDPSTGAVLGHAEKIIDWDTGNDTAVIG